MDLETFKQSLTEDFNDHKFVKVNAGLTIGHSIMKQFITDKLTATQPGQKPTADNDELFNMIRVLAKSNAAILTSLGRAQYHEKITRALTSEVNDVKSAKD